VIRTEINEMVSLAERLLTAGEPGILATLFAANGSTYRPLGSMMLAGPSSAMTVGGVSGGCLEDYIARRGRMLTEAKPAILLRFNSAPDAGADVPMLGCGGTIEVLVERFTTEHMAFLRWLAALYESDYASDAVVVIETAASGELAVRRWLDFELRSKPIPRLESLRRRAIAGERSVQASIGPNQRALVHYVAPLRRLILFGAGNDVPPLATLGRSLGWHVCVADRQARRASRSRFPDVDQIVAADWHGAVQAIKFTPNSAVVVMTHNVDDDAEILSLLADRPLGYIGVLGPQRRRDWLIENLDIRTPQSAAFAGRIRGPIGLDLGERSAMGIAVSIVGEIVAQLNGRTAQPLSASAIESNADHSALPLLAPADSLTIVKGCSYCETDGR
jgi:xanthine dehydrogenase accessory factor